VSESGDENGYPLSYHENAHATIHGHGHENVLVLSLANHLEQGHFEMLKPCSVF
jgi:hypothetical protein